MTRDTKRRISAARAGRRSLAVACGLLAGILFAAGADLCVAATLDLGTVAGQVGTTVLLPIELSGLGADAIDAFEFEVTWTAQYAQFAGLESTGTLSAGWMTVFDSGDGTASIAAAGLVPITADGTLVYLRFLLGPDSGTVSVYWSTAVLNEGEPDPFLVGGQLQISALPTLDVRPDTGILAVGETTTFLTTGGTPPYTYSSSDPAVADFSGDVMTARAPGRSQVEVQDSGGLTDRTDGEFEIRPFRIEVADRSVVSGSTIRIPVLLGEVSAFDIVAVEFDLEFGPEALTYAGFSTVGSLIGAAGWSDPEVSVQDGRVNFAAAGTTALAGAGAVLYVDFVVHSSSWISPGAGSFNEAYCALPDAGYLSVTAAPVITISPTSSQLLVGETQTFSAHGTISPPLTWSVDDVSVAGIDGSGQLRGLDEGVVRVRVEDSIGVVGWSQEIRVCHVGLPPLEASIGPSEFVIIPVRANRTLDGLGIHSLEISLGYDPALATFLAVATAGTLTDSWGAPVVNDRLGSVGIYLAGAEPLEGCEPALIYLYFQGDPGISGEYTGLHLTSALLNEGSPCVMIDRGQACAGGSPAPLPAIRSLEVSNHPNPFNPRTTIRFSTPVEGQAEVTVYSARGERVRTLWTGFLVAGVERTVTWDGCDDQGRRQASGVYTAQLESGRQRQRTKMVLLK